MGIKWIFEPPDELLVRASKNLRGGESLEKIILNLIRSWIMQREEQQLKKDKRKRA